jgi:hypothetical protein
MSEPHVPPALEGLIRTIVGGAGEHERDERASTFARGLALGALVGAAIAGSTVWQRRQARLAKDVSALRADGPATVEGTAPAPR